MYIPTVRVVLDSRGVETMPETFTIPKKKSVDLYQAITENSRQGKDLIRELKQTVIEDGHKLQFSNLRLVHSPCDVQYAAWRRERRCARYSAAELEQKYGFRVVSSEEEARQLCEKGLRVGDLLKSSTSCLGDPKFGVYLNRCIMSAVDIAGYRRGKSVSLVVFKVTRGRVKTVTPSDINSRRRSSSRPKHTALLDPTPNFDCHVARPGSAMHQSLLFLYEFSEDGTPSKNPRHCCPHAVVDVTLIAQDVPSASSQNPVRHHAAFPSEWEGTMSFTEDEQTLVELSTMDPSKECFMKVPAFRDEVQLHCVLPRSALAEIIPLSHLDELTKTSKPHVHQGGMTAQWLHVILNHPHEYARGVLCDRGCVQVGGVGERDELMVLLCGTGECSSRPFVLWLCFELDAVPSALSVLQECYAHSHVYLEKLNLREIDGSPTSAHMQTRCRNASLGDSNDAEVEKLPVSSRQTKGACLRYSQDKVIHGMTFEHDNSPVSRLPAAETDRGYIVPEVSLSADASLYSSQGVTAAERERGEWYCDIGLQLPSTGTDNCFPADNSEDEGTAWMQTDTQDCTTVFNTASGEWEDAPVFTEGQEFVATSPQKPTAEVLWDDGYQHNISSDGVPMLSEEPLPGCGTNQNGSDNGKFNFNQAHECSGLYNCARDRNEFRGMAIFSSSTKDVAPMSISSEHSGQSVLYNSYQTDRDDAVVDFPYPSPPPNMASRAAVEKSQSTCDQRWSDCGTDSPQDFRYDVPLSAGASISDHASPSSLPAEHEFPDDRRDLMHAPLQQLVQWHYHVQQPPRDLQQQQQQQQQQQDYQDHHQQQQQEVQQHPYQQQRREMQDQEYQDHRQQQQDDYQDHHQQQQQDFQDYPQQQQQEVQQHPYQQQQREVQDQEYQDHHQQQQQDYQDHHQQQQEEVQQHLYKWQHQALNIADSRYLLQQNHPEAMDIRPEGTLSSELYGSGGAPPANCKFVFNQCTESIAVSSQVKGGVVAAVDYTDEQSSVDMDIESQDEETLVHPWESPLYKVVDDKICNSGDVSDMNFNYLLQSGFLSRILTSCGESNVAVRARASQDPALENRFRYLLNKLWNSLSGAEVPHIQAAIGVALSQMSQPTPIPEPPLPTTSPISPPSPPPALPRDSPPPLPPSPPPPPPPPYAAVTPKRPPSHSKRAVPETGPDSLCLSPVTPVSPASAVAELLAAMRKSKSTPGSPDKDTGSSNAGKKQPEKRGDLSSTDPVPCLLSPSHTMPKATRECSQCEQHSPEKCIPVPAISPPTKKVCTTVPVSPATQKVPVRSSLSSPITVRRMRIAKAPAKPVEVAKKVATNTKVGPLSGSACRNASELSASVCSSSGSGSACRSVIEVSTRGDPSSGPACRSASKVSARGCPSSGPACGSASEVSASLPPVTRDKPTDSAKTTPVTHAVGAPQKDPSPACPVPVTTRQRQTDRSHAAEASCVPEEASGVCCSARKVIALAPGNLHISPPLLTSASITEPVNVSSKLNCGQVSSPCTQTAEKTRTIATTESQRRSTSSSSPTSSSARPKPILRTVSGLTKSMEKSRKGLPDRTGGTTTTTIATTSVISSSVSASTTTTTIAADVKVSCRLNFDVCPTMEARKSSSAPAAGRTVPLKRSITSSDTITIAVSRSSSEPNSASKEKLSVHKARPLLSKLPSHYNRSSHGHKAPSDYRPHVPLRSEQQPHVAGGNVKRSNRPLLPSRYIKSDSCGRSPNEYRRHITVRSEEEKRCVEDFSSALGSRARSRSPYYERGMHYATPVGECDRNRHSNSYYNTTNLEVNDYQRRHGRHSPAAEEGTYYDMGLPYHSPRSNRQRSPLLVRRDMGIRRTVPNRR